jgi:phosphoglycolate phosphatase-like HAD superfamily hydrolase
MQFSPAQMPKLLLWDIDGTLLLTKGAGLRGMRRAAQILYGPDFRWDGPIDARGNLDPLIFEAALAHNGIALTDDGHRAFHDEYIRQLTAELDGNKTIGRIMPGIEAVLGTLRSRSDVIQGMVTGNYAAAAPLKLRACGLALEWFEITAFGDEGRTRPDLVALAMRKCAERRGWAPHPRDVVVIGDTPRDVECARAHGCVAFAVATGGHTVDELVAANADVVVSDLSDPSALYAIIG